MTTPSKFYTLLLYLHSVGDDMQPGHNCILLEVGGSSEYISRSCRISLCALINKFEGNLQVVIIALMKLVMAAML